MFGSKEKKIGNLIKRKKWDILKKKYLYADTDTRLLLAKECGNSMDPGVNTILVALFRDPDENVQLESVRAMAKTGKDHEVSQLQWLLSNTPDDKEELKYAIQTAISNIRGKK